MTHKELFLVVTNSDVGQCLAVLGKVVQLLFHKRAVSQTQVGEGDTFARKPEEQEDVFPQQICAIPLGHATEATGSELITAVKHSGERFCRARCQAEVAGDSKSVHTLVCARVLVVTCPKISIVCLDLMEVTHKEVPVLVF